MPSVTTGDNAVQSSSPDLASAPSEALKQVLGVIDKKVRNMEKKKSKLDDYQTRKNKGERLNQDQLEALSKAPEVAHNLDFARELQKNFLALNVEIQKSVKKATRREQLKREEVERKRLKAVLEVQYLLEQLGEEKATYSSSDKEQGAEWNTSSQQPPAAMSPALVSSEPHTLNAVLPPPAADPVVRKQAVQDLMAQMQGTFNFMQDSMLEFEGPPLDPAIVSAQPMKPAQMVCQPESRLPQHNALSVQPEPTQVPMVSAPKEAYSSTPPLYQPPHNSEPRPQTDTIDPLQVTAYTAQTPTPSSQPQVFQPVSKPLHSGINVNAAPFQSMQAVFNMNAPVPPNNEMDSQKISSQYQSSYGQGFSTQATLPAEQQELPQEALQSVGPFHSQDQGIPSAGVHQSASQQPSGQGTGFGRPGQSFYNNRAMPRAGPRNPRGALNGFRGPSNGFRGGYDGSYRAPFPNTPNTGYGQTQFSTPRDYSNNTYQRDGYQQSFKRGATQGPRGCSRGNAQAMRS
uniref:Cell cycle associated protein 1a n=1 Tax=Cyprinus carpio TaxID=7962 RepID=A0A8C2H8X9_CYPCA